MNIKDLDKISENWKRKYRKKLLENLDNHLNWMNNVFFPAFDIKNSKQKNPIFSTSKNVASFDSEEREPLIDIVSNYKEDLIFHKEKVLWKSNENIKGLSFRLMYDAEYIEKLINNLLSQSNKEIVKEILDRVDKEVIGEDEREPNFESKDWLYIPAKNKHRAEQRQSLKLLVNQSK